MTLFFFATNTYCLMEPKGYYYQKEVKSYGKQSSNQSRKATDGWKT